MKHKKLEKYFGPSNDELGRQLSRYKISQIHYSQKNCKPKNEKNQQKMENRTAI